MIRMFDIVQVDFGETLEGEQGGERPAVIIQNNIGNEVSPSVLVIPLTKELKKLYLPTHKVIHKSKANGLTYNSMLLGEQIRSVSKKRIKYIRGYIDREEDKNSAIEVYLANVTGKRNCSIA